MRLRMPYRRIHVLGASGSGTTTLGKAMAEAFNYKHMDADDYYWLDTKISYTEKRPEPECVRLLEKEMRTRSPWVLSGSLCGWGESLMGRIDLVVFLDLPEEIRMKRLVEREWRRYGDRMMPDRVKNGLHQAFMEWASSCEGQNRSLTNASIHEDWITKIGCPVLRLDGDLTVPERMASVLAFQCSGNGASTDVQG